MTFDDLDKKASELVLELESSNPLIRKYQSLFTLSFIAGYEYTEADLNPFLSTIEQTYPKDETAKNIAILGWHKGEDLAIFHKESIEHLNRSFYQKLE
jgi:hypothetical protein